MITQELKDRLIADYPKFEDMTHKFYKKEMSIADYKGQSGAYGSYAERGANSLQWGTHDSSAHAVLS